MPRGDVGRATATALLVYALFWNPWLQFSNASNFLDAAVSYVDTGRWALAHADLYEAKDTATARDGRLVPGVPIGTALVIVPLYVAWRAVEGRVDTMDRFHAFNGFVALALGATATAATVAQVHWLAGWLGAGPVGQRRAALLFAFGTQAFQFGTMVTKESLTALALTSALRLGLGAGDAARRVAAGALGGATVLLTHSTAPFPVLLGALVLARHGARNALLVVLGALPLALALGAYDATMFGAPWRTSYSSITGLTTRWVAPKAAIVADLVLGPRGGLLLYSPFLLLGLAALVRVWRTRWRGEAVLTTALVLALLGLAASWQSQFGARASWAHGLGPRHLFPVVPVLAAFAGVSLERLSWRALAIVALPSVACGYLGAQAGLAPVPNALPYAVKTLLSGTGMGVAFKEGLPRWLGFDNLHTLVSRPDVRAVDVLAMLSTPAGRHLALAQAACLTANALAGAGVAWIVVRVWRPRAATAEATACAS